MLEEPSPFLQGKVATILGWRPETWRRVSRGYSGATRYLVGKAGSSAFVKIGGTAQTARLLRREISVYGSLHAPFMPEVYGWDESADEPILVLEDLGAASWPPPWSAEQIDLVLSQVHAMHGHRAALERRTLLHSGREAGWPAVARDPEPFLSLQLVDRRWLENSLPVLQAAEAECALEGDAVTHLDLRSDNICITKQGVKFIDWAEAGLSNPQVDLGFWLPSLHFEGGPRPEDILPDAPQISALVSGYFAARAGLPIIPEAPHVRRVQKEQLAAALPWAQRALGLPPL